MNSQTYLLCIKEKCLEVLEKVDYRERFWVRKAKVKVSIRVAHKLLEEMTIDSPTRTDGIPLDKQIILRVAFINLQHPKCATANLLVFLGKEDIDFLLRQES